MERKLVYIIMMLVLFAAVATLGSRSALGDEFGTIWLASQPDARFIIETVHQTDVHPPTSYLFLHYWGKLFGYGDFAMRIPSVIFILLSLIVVWKLIEVFLGQRDGSERLAVFALCATAPVLWVMAGFARYYAAGNLLGCLSIYAYLLWFRNGGLPLLLLTIITTCSLFYTHYLLAAIIALSQGLHYLSYLRTKKAREAAVWLFSQVSIIILALPTIVWSIAPLLSGKTSSLANQAHEGLSGLKAIPLAFVGQIFSALSGGVPYPWDLWITVPLLVLFCLLLVNGLKSAIFRNREVLFLFAIPFVLLAIAIPVIMPVIGYFGGIFRVAPIAVLFWIFLGFSAISIAGRTARYAVIFLALVCNMYSVVVFDLNLPSMSQTPPIKEIADFIRTSTQDRSAIVFNPFNHGWGDPIARYLPGHESRILTDNQSGMTLDSCKSLITERNPRGVWLIEPNRLKSRADMLSEWLSAKGYSVRLKRDFQRQSDYDVWVKDTLKSLTFLRLKPNPSQRYILTVKYFGRTS